MGQSSSQIAWYTIIGGGSGRGVLQSDKISPKCHFALFYAFLGPFWLQGPTVPQNGRLKPENVDHRPFF